MKYILLIILTIGTASSDMGSWSIVDGKLYYKSLYVDSDQDFSIDSENPEVRPLFKIIEDSSAGIDWLLITSKEGHSELWVYRYRNDKKLERLDSYSFSLSMRKLASDYILLERRHMGLSIGYIYQLLENGTVKRSTKISDLILFDPSIGLVVQLLTEKDFSNKISISTLFSEKIAYLSIGYSPVFMTDRLTNIEVDRSGCILNLEYKNNGKDSLYENLKIPNEQCLK